MYGDDMDLNISLLLLYFTTLRYLGFDSLSEVVIEDYGLSWGILNTFLSV